MKEKLIADALKTEEGKKVLHEAMFPSNKIKLNENAKNFVRYYKKKIEEEKQNIRRKFK